MAHITGDHHQDDPDVSLHLEGWRDIEIIEQDDTVLRLEATDDGGQTAQLTIRAPQALSVDVRLRSTSRPRATITAIEVSGQTVKE